MNTIAVAQVSGVCRVIIPSDSVLVSVDELLETCDGFLLDRPGDEAAPRNYGESATEAHGTFDRARDAICPWACARLCRGGTAFLACAGVPRAMWPWRERSTLRSVELPGRMNHRMPPMAPMEQNVRAGRPMDFYPKAAVSRARGLRQRLRTNTFARAGDQSPARA